MPSAPPEAGATGAPGAEAGGVDGEEPPVIARLAHGGTLSSQVSRGLAWTAGTRLGLVVLQVAVQAVVMRLLLPSDYGLVVVATALSTFAAFLTDLGLTTALVQARRVTQRLLRTAFWLNAVVGAVVTAVVVAVAPLVALAYDEPRITPLLQLTALGFVLNVVPVPTALLQRTLRFRELVGAETTATVVGMAATVALAVAGAGPYALVLGPLVKILATDVLLWSVVRWWPGRGFLHRPELGQLWRFGRGVSGANMLYAASASADGLILATAVGPTQLGLYDRSVKIIMLPVNQVTTVLTRVMLPAFSQMQDDLARLRRAWALATRASLLFGVPLGVGVATTAPALVETVYGATWLPMVPTLVLLALSVPARVVARNSGPVYQALGRTGLQFRLAVVSTVVTVGAIVVGLRWGAVGVATALLASSLVVTVIGLVPLLRALGGTARDLWTTCRGALAAGLALAAAVLGVGALAEGLPPWAVLVLQVAAGAAVYLPLVLLLEREVVRAFRERGAATPVTGTAPGT